MRNLYVEILLYCIILLHFTTQRTQKTYFVSIWNASAKNSPKTTDISIHIKHTNAKIWDKINIEYKNISLLEHGYFSVDIHK